VDAALLQALVPAISLAAPLLGAISGVRFVQESERGVKLRWGRAIRNRDGTPRIVEPGFVLTLPTVHRLRRVHVRTKTLALGKQWIMLADHTTFSVGALVVTRIMDTPSAVYRSLFEVDDVENSVEMYCASALRDVLLTIRYTDLAEPDQLAGRVRERVEPRLAEWGVRVEEIRLTDCSPTPETARMILTMTEANAKADALIQAAEKLDAAGHAIEPSLAAALIGTPVAVAIGDSRVASVPAQSGDRSSRRPAVVNGGERESDVLETDRAS
jgi:regulator of protease activity HflC (stomatin/prohibitin superfamily)